MPESQILSMEQVDALESTLTNFEDQRIINLISTVRWLSKLADEHKQLHIETGSVSTQLLEENDRLRDELKRRQAECAVMREVVDAVKNWRYGLIDKQTHGDVGSIACAYPAIYRLATTFDELENVIYPKDAHSERTCNNDGHKLTREQP